MSESAPPSDKEADGPVEAALCRLRELPLVKSVFPINGACPGYQAQLWCSAAHHDPRAAKEQAQVTRERDMLGCIERVQFLVQSEHSNAACLAAAEAARCAAAAEAAAAAGSSAPTSAFAAMAAAQHVKPAAEKAATAEKLAVEARAAAQAAEAQLEAANQVVAAAEAEARRLEDEVNAADSNCALLVLSRPMGFGGRIFSCDSGRGLQSSKGTRNPHAKS